MSSGVFTFGKCKGQTFSEVARTNSAYCRWALSQESPGGGLKAFVDYLKARKVAAPLPLPDPGKSGSSAGMVAKQGHSPTKENDSRSSSLANSGNRWGPLLSPTKVSPFSLGSPLAPSSVSSARSSPGVSPSLVSPFTPAPPAPSLTGSALLTAPGRAQAPLGSLLAPAATAGGAAAQGGHMGLDWARAVLDASPSKASSRAVPSPVAPAPLAADPQAGGDDVLLLSGSNEVTVELVNLGQVHVYIDSAEGRGRGLLPAALRQGLSRVPEHHVSSTHFSFPYAQYETVLRLLRQCVRPTKAIAEIPPWVQKAISGLPQVKMPTDIAYVDYLPPAAAKNFPDGLMPYQREGVQFAISRLGRCLIADEMGLGKTIQAIAVMAHYVEDWPCLVICPSSLRSQWKEQILEWAPHLCRPDEVQVISTGKDVISDNSKIVIISYHMVVNPIFQRRPSGESFRMVVADESHAIKDPKAKRTKAVQPLLCKSTRAILLSGTPAMNFAAELHTQLQALMPRAIPNYHQFVTRFSEKKVQRLGKGREATKFTGARRKHELNTLLCNTVMIRRMKKDVLTQLPSKRRAKVVLAPSNKAAHDELLAKSTSFQSVLDGSAESTTSIGELFQLCGKAKQEAVVDYVKYLLEANVKCLIFAHHRFMLDTLEDMVQKARVGYIRIDGSTSQDRRPNLVKQFQTQEDCQIALLSITACGEGLNLTAASTVVFAELYWVPGAMEQAEARAHRMGSQHASINVYFLVLQGETPDATMYKVLDRKKLDTSSILDGKSQGFESSVGQLRPDVGDAPSPGSKRRAAETEDLDIRAFFDDNPAKVARTESPKKKASGPVVCVDTP